MDWFADDAETILHWHERPSGQHIELGIAETNLVGLIGELGATWSRWGEPLLPIGVLYDPFVGRALEPWSFGIYAGGQSILVGTPSGVTLAAEGGAQLVVTCRPEPIPQRRAHEPVGRSAELAGGVLRLGDGETIAGHDDDVAGVGEHHGRVVGGGRIDRQHLAGARTPAAGARRGSRIVVSTR